MIRIFAKQAFFDRSGVIEQDMVAMVMITASQCRAARALLEWSQQDLATSAGVGVVTVRQFESNNAAPRSATLDVIRRAFETAGVIFIAENGEGPGVRLRKAQ